VSPFFRSGFDPHAPGESHLDCRCVDGVQGRVRLLERVNVACIWRRNGGILAAAAAEAEDGIRTFHRGREGTERCEANLYDQKITTRF
jgi:hypothetical protein